MKVEEIKKGGAYQVSCTRRRPTPRFPQGIVDGTSTDNFLVYDCGFDHDNLWWADCINLHDRSQRRIRDSHTFIREITKLKENDLVDVVGWVMLQKLEQGQYRILKISETNCQLVYSFSRPRGKKCLVRHYVKSIDLWVKPPNSPDLNKIVVKQ